MSHYHVEINSIAVDFNPFQGTITDFEEKGILKKKQRIRVYLINHYKPPTKHEKSIHYRNSSFFINYR